MLAEAKFQTRNLYCRNIFNSVLYDGYDIWSDLDKSSVLELLTDENNINIQLKNLIFYNDYLGKYSNNIFTYTTNNNY